MRTPAEHELMVGYMVRDVWAAWHLRHAAAPARGSRVFASSISRPGRPEAHPLRTVGALRACAQPRAVNADRVAAAGWGEGAAACQRDLV
jgi:hypothetical protein